MTVINKTLLILLYGLMQKLECDHWNIIQSKLEKSSWLLPFSPWGSEALWVYTGDLGKRSLWHLWKRSAARHPIIIMSEPWSVLYLLWPQLLVALPTFTEQQNVCKVHQMLPYPILVCLNSFPLISCISAKIFIDIHCCSWQIVGNEPRKKMMW